MDIEYLLWLQKIREAAGPLLEYIFYFITLMAVGGIVVSFIVYYCFDKEKGYHAIISFLIGNVFVQCLKNVFCINRPWIRDKRVHPSILGMKGATGYSFPSGHSNAAASSYGSLAYQYRKKRRGISIALIVLILLAGFSRNYLGVHTPQDVIVGLLCGSGAVFLTEWLFKLKETHHRHEWMVSGAILIICMVLSIWTCLKGYPSVYADGQLVVDPVKMQRDALQGYGMLSGFVIGYVLEGKYIGFSNENLSRKKRIFRIMISVFLELLVYLLFHNVLINVIEQRVCYFCMGFALMFSAACIIPYLFKKMGI